MSVAESILYHSLHFVLGFLYLLVFAIFNWFLDCLSDTSLLQKLPPVTTNMVVVVCRLLMLRFCDIEVFYVELLQPSDRLKTEEEIAKEEKEKLEALEVSN